MVRQEVATLEQARVSDAELQRLKVASSSGDSTSGSMKSTKGIRNRMNGFLASPSLRTCFRRDRSKYHIASEMHGIRLAATFLSGCKKTLSRSFTGSAENPALGKAL